MSRRVLVIGLDGATWDQIEPMFARGIMPNLKKLLDGGSRGVLNSVFPPITAPAWSSIYTGTNPGKHGIFDFMRRLSGTYQVAPIDATFRDGKSIFRLVSDAGGQVFALNPPLTYPAEELNGALIPGLPTPGFSISPSSLAGDFLEAVPGYDPYPAEFGHLVGHTDSLRGLADDYVEKCVQGYRFMAGRFPDWRLGLVHFQVTDVAEHFAWGDQELLDTVHARVDQGLGELLSDLPEDTTVLVISDHGHGSLTALIHVNEWLRSHGFLALKSGPLRSLKKVAYRAGLTPTRAYKLMVRLGLRRAVQTAVHSRPQGVRSLLRRVFVSFDDVDWSRTRAYSIGNAGQIYMNVRGRDPEGIIEPGPELERTTEALSRELLEMKHPWTGESLIREVQRGSELYDGPRAADAPDLFWIPRDFSLWAFAQNEFASSSWFSKPHDGRTGHHRMEGIIGVAGAGAVSGGVLEASLLDVAPTVLSLLGIPLPGYLDGRPLTEAFAGGLQSGEAEGTAEIEAGSRTGYNEEDAALVAKRLEDLGYL